MKTITVLFTISIICLIGYLYLFIRSYIEERRRKKNIPDWDNMTVEEVIDTLNEPQKRALYFLVGEAVKEAKQEPIHIETFHTEPVVLKTRVCIDYTMLNHMDEEDILGLVTERLARDFGNAIVENPDLYSIRDELDPMNMNKIYEARIRIVPWK
jgi:hypothetical protein